MAWLTDEQLVAQTGEHATGPELALASSVITTYAGVDEAMPAEAISARDRRTLARATGWQVLWMKNQPGHLTHRQVDYSPSADGTSADRRSQADQDLAPLAQRELKNLSWNGTRVVDLSGRRQVPKGALMTDFLNESSDYWSVPNA